jgi:lipopolysaccharide/colanic/teichoic acid biosynthesis glycosyltransferase
MESSTTHAYVKTVPVPAWGMRRRRLPWLTEAAKRCFDAGIALIGLIVLGPFLAVIGLAIRRDSPGPALYRGRRTGKDGKPFEMLKFRSMHELPESYQGPPVTAQDDPRLTRLGRWLRHTKLNELPQLWNVLRGEMSLVGPRPEDPEIVAAWPEEVRREVLSVRPGVTSPASVLYRDEETMLPVDDVMAGYLEGVLPSKLRLDQLYVRHRSPLLDLDILLWTLIVLMVRLRAVSPAERSLFKGPISKLVGRHMSWFAIDALVTFACIGGVGVLWRAFEPLNVGLPKAVLVALGFALLYSLTNVALGVNRIAWSSAEAADALNLAPSLLVGGAAALLANRFLGKGALLPPVLVAFSATLAFMGFVAVRYRSRLLSGAVSRLLRLRGEAQVAQERALIVGGGDAGQFVAWLLKNSRPGRAFHVVGFVDDDLYKQDTRIRGLHVIGGREDIPRLVAEHDVGLLIFAIHNISPYERARLLEICAETPARVVLIPDILGALNHTERTGAEDVPQPVFTIPDPAALGVLMGLPERQVKSWLGEIGALADGGDVAGVQAFVQALLARISAGEASWEEVEVQDAHRAPGRQEWDSA